MVQSLNSLQHFFYNLVDPNQVQFYGRPQNATNEALWQKAVRENPDPSWYAFIYKQKSSGLTSRVVMSLP